MVTFNEHISGLIVWGFEMPNAPYSNRLEARLMVYLPSREYNGLIEKHLPDRYIWILNINDLSL